MGKDFVLINLKNLDAKNFGLGEALSVNIIHTWVVVFFKLTP